MDRKYIHSITKIEACELKFKTTIKLDYFRTVLLHNIDH